MSPPPDPPPAAGAPPPAPPPGGSKLIIPVLAFSFVNLLGTAFIATRVNKQPKVIIAGAEGVHAEGGHDDKPKGPPPTAMVEPFVVNLNEPGSSRYLKIGMEFELTSPRAVEELNESKRAVRDEMLRYLSSLAVQDTLGEANKTKIQEQITSRVDKVLGGGRIRRLFFTDFVVQ